MSAMERERARLREALLDYGQHDSWRCHHPDRYEQDPDCCCGLVSTMRDLGFAVTFDGTGAARFAVSVADIPQEDRRT